MSCLGHCYEPIPPRVWSRVESPCPYEDQVTYPTVIDVYFGLKPPPSPLQAQWALQQYHKGNVLQYKKNNANMSKQQKYAQIAKGIWKTRNTTWSSQKVNASNVTTDPNTNLLKRVNYRKVYLASGLPAPSDASLTCPLNYATTPYNQIVIANGGNLVCGTLENPCTGEIMEKPIQYVTCNPSSNSDVPGPVVPLCWNDGFAPWYPKTRHVMGSTGNKFPQGYKDLKSAIQETC